MSVEVLILSEPGDYKVSEKLTIRVLQPKVILLNPEFKVRVGSTVKPTKEST